MSVGENVPDCGAEIKADTVIKEGGPMMLRRHDSSMGLNEPPSRSRSLRRCALANRRCRSGRAVGGERVVTGPRRGTAPRLLLSPAVRVGFRPTSDNT